MSPEERYCFDVQGYLILEDAIEPEYLARLNARLDLWEERARQQRAGAAPDGVGIPFFNLLNEEPGMLDLVVNPKILPYVDAMVERPILEQFAVLFRWRGAQSGAHGGHTPYQPINHYGVSQGRIYSNHFRVMYVMHDIGPGEGGLQVIPGSHKANFPWPGATELAQMEGSLKRLFVELTAPAGSAVLFTHDILHASCNESEKVRRVLHVAYNYGGFSRGWLAEHTDYERLFAAAPPGSWLQYLLRRPDYGDSVPKPPLPRRERQ